MTKSSKLDILFDPLHKIKNAPTYQARNQAVQEFLDQQPEKFIDLLEKNKSNSPSRQELLSLNDFVYYSCVYYIARDFCKNHLASTPKQGNIINENKELFLSNLLEQQDHFNDIKKLGSLKSELFNPRALEKYKPNNLKSKEWIQEWHKNQQQYFSRLADYYDLNKGQEDYISEEEIEKNTQKSSDNTEKAMWIGAFLIALLALGAAAPLTMGLYQLFLSGTSTMASVVSYIAAGSVSLTIAGYVGAKTISKFSSNLLDKLEDRKDYDEHRKAILEELKLHCPKNNKSLEDEDNEHNIKPLSGEPLLNQNQKQHINEGTN